MTEEQFGGAKLVAMPKPKADQEADTRVAEIKKVLNDILDNHKIEGFTFFGRMNDGGIVSAGNGLHPGDMCMAATILNHMALRDAGITK